MTAKLLEKHITDTIREWQVKIGYEGGTMKLYYPAESLRRSLSLDETEDLGKSGSDTKKRCHAVWKAQNLAYYLCFIELFTMYISLPAFS